MLTGHSEEWRVIQARDVGVTQFLAKPVSARALYTRIVSAIEKSIRQRPRRRPPPPGTTSRSPRSTRC